MTGTDPFEMVAGRELKFVLSLPESKDIFKKPEKVTLTLEPPAGVSREQP